jgi:hypothetical protein
VRTGALQVGMLARFENDEADRQELIRKWTADIESRCPQCGA